LLLPPPAPRSPLFPYTTLFRSRADARGYAGGQVTRYGFVLAIVGAAATISWRAQRVPLLKRLGPISYVLMTAFTSLTYNPRNYRSEEHTSELQSRFDLVCRLLL